ncbi:hypothetical protein GLOIN_2v1789626 [Rhizophagus irregularis DAOM 181602=DAOM 197198]|uniref:Uncharacterized protein n=1 Tax=Rhizophagus irregularis (strain DAOM 181602 / DAOM 197198 / MUCL 43194) TaxID=747089 RepID=A0A2P4P0Y0_RHIID|nr:hypothetical protein GLOIN_2v1789626 [Rhizophagus irregularis DAOM 181602=DAOM 197198]POG59045.1 hypothetical protein GLOIN_2v1789626 [Rhizophagus irregularis DAOM 181602=DAOM 197198]|eukprot:XP_025165911.1 hypothetical protein GLOIN_2v1789626 [Rhizophagus irregularis DAOM 181602=DAOM 197198]
MTYLPSFNKITKIKPRKIILSLTPLNDNKLLESHLSIVPNREGYYLTNICLICYDYIWNDPFRNVLKADLVNYETTFEEIIKIFEIQDFPMQGLQNPLTLSSFTPQSFTSQSITPHFYAHPTDSFTSIHPSPSNYEYTSYSLP